MTNTAEYLSRSRLFRRLRSGAHGHLVELYAARLVEVGLSKHGTWRSLNVVGNLLAWMTSHRTKLSSLDEHMVERYLRHQGAKQTIHLDDRAALKRWLLTLRAAGAIAPAPVPMNTPLQQIFAEFGDYLRSERGLTAKTIAHHQPAIRRFLFEVCPAGASDLGKIKQDEVIRHVECHAQDGSPKSAKLMCWSLRAFLRYLHHTGLNPHALAGCVPSIRQWNLVGLPTCLSAAQVQKALDGCDRASAVGRRDFAVLIMLSKNFSRSTSTTTRRPCSTYCLAA